jgi:sulfoxide reductase catalytic subunit YedY
MIPIKPSEITPEHVYRSRREFIRDMGVLAVGSLLLSACGALPSRQKEPTPGATGVEAGSSPVPFPPLQGTADELGAGLTSFESVTNYNNFYEFTTGKEDVARLARNFKTSPWTVEVGGLVSKPQVLSMDDLLSFPQEERIYRLRCVETWSMVIPWVGFPLARLLKEVEPLAQARYVRFETLDDPGQMPGQKNGSYPWPYVEGLRLDEAMNDLTLLATGLYGKALLPKNGAPVRLVVPWKYGFKSCKSVARIDLVEEMPVSLWMAVNPQEYGFYANVNPDVPHARWPQATEHRIGESGRIPTLLFNGYADEVAHMYQPPDLRDWYF